MNLQLNARIKDPQERDDKRIPKRTIVFLFRNTPKIENLREREDKRIPERTMALATPFQKYPKDRGPTRKE